MFSKLLLKEVRAIFKSPSFYFFAALFAFIGNWMFFNNLYHYINNIQAMVNSQTMHQAIVESVVFQTFSNLNFLGLLFCPMILMRSFVDEKQANTMTLLWNSLLNDGQIVLAKFFAYFLFVLFLLCTTTAIVGVAWYKDLVTIDYLLSGYLALAANYALYVAIGIFTSSIAKNLASAAISQIVIVFLFIFFSWGAQLVSEPAFAEVIEQFGMVAYFKDNLRGFLRISSLFYYVSVVGLFLFLTKKSLESRNW